MCMHAGLAQPMASSPRVKVNGQPIVTQTNAFVIAGCALVSIPLPPCVTAQWVTAATRVQSNGVPVLLQDSQAMCVPTGTGLKVVVVQSRVRGI